MKTLISLIIRLWLMFLPIPMIAVIFYTDKRLLHVALSPFFYLIGFTLATYFFPSFPRLGWTVFLLAPILAAFTKPFTITKICPSSILLASV